MNLPRSQKLILPPEACSQNGDIRYAASSFPGVFLSTAPQPVLPRARFIHGTSNMIPIKGIRTHAGRLFNS
jgi:hypothetical protein